MLIFGGLIFRVFVLQLIRMILSVARLLGSVKSFWGVLFVFVFLFLFSPGTLFPVSCFPLRVFLLAGFNKAKQL